MAMFINPPELAIYCVIWRVEPTITLMYRKSMEAVVVVVILFLLYIYRSRQKIL